MSGIERIAAERRRQVEAEGWTAGHDDEHTDGSLAVVAMFYARHAAHIAKILRPRGMLIAPRHWPERWGADWWKPHPRYGGRVTAQDAIRNLEKAGALIAAEIDRLERIERKESGVLVPARQAMPRGRAPGDREPMSLISCHKKTSRSAANEADTAEVHTVENMHRAAKIRWIRKNGAVYSYDEERQRPENPDLLYESAGRAQEILAERGYEVTWIVDDPRLAAEHGAVGQTREAGGGIVTTSRIIGWCPECGYDPALDEDGCCRACGADATGPGADAAVRNYVALRKIAAEIDRLERIERKGEAS